MRSVLLVVLALWVLCIRTRGCGEQRTTVQGMLEQSTFLPQRRSRTSLGSVDGLWWHGSRWKMKRHLLSEVAADTTASDKQILCCVRKCKLLQEDSHVASPLPWHQGRILPLGNRDFTAVENVAQHNTAHMWMHNKHVDMSSRDGGLVARDNVVFNGVAQTDIAHVSSHTKQILAHGRASVAMRRTSLLDVLDGTSADKQANAVRRQGIDSALLKYTGLTLSGDTQTGVIYDVGLPPSLAGIEAQAIRINSTTSQAGFTFNEFTFPINSSFIPESAYVALVYRSISSFTVYTLPSEYRLGGPIIGIISSSSNFTSIDPSLPPGSISFPANTYINISLPTFSTSPGSDALCAFFASNGSIFTTNLASPPNFCLSSTLGDYAIITKASSTQSPTQNASPSSSPSDGSVRSPSSSSKKSSTNWRLIAGGTCLTLAGLAFLIAVVLISIKLTENVKLLLKTRYTQNDEALQDSLVGGSIAPSAPVIRTKPALEIDVARFSRQPDV